VLASLCSSEAKTLTLGSRTGSLLPLALAAWTDKSYFLLGSRLSRANLGSVETSLRRVCPAGPSAWTAAPTDTTCSSESSASESSRRLSRGLFLASLTSSTKYWGIPPSSPAMHNTSSPEGDELLLDTVHCSGGRGASVTSARARRVAHNYK